ncbi:putative adhesin [Streptomyces vinaceus]|uniref:putative adhesin n=1 Tax=Streptomyces vinaceus TaxID=1960 RepID=UPI0038036BA7
MGSTFISGHGSAGLLDGTTFVPKGRALHLYTKSGEAMSSITGLQIANGTKAVPCETFVGPCANVPNQQLFALSPEELQQEYASRTDSPGLRVGSYLTVGGDLAVGGDRPDHLSVCTDNGPFGKCSPKVGHVCDGIFSPTFQSKYHIEDEIHLLACRVDEMWHIRRTMGMKDHRNYRDAGLGTDLDFHTKELHEKYVTLKNCTDKSFIEEILQCTEATRAHLMSYPYIKKRIEDAWQSLEKNPYSVPAGMNELGHEVRLYRKQAEQRQQALEKNASLGFFSSHAEEVPVPEAPAPIDMSRFQGRFKFPPNFASAGMWHQAFGRWLLCPQMGRPPQEWELFNLFTTSNAAEPYLHPLTDTPMNSLYIVREFVEGRTGPSGASREIPQISAEAEYMNALYRKIEAAYHYCQEMIGAWDEILRSDEGSWTGAMILEDREGFYQDLSRACNEDVHFVDEVTQCWDLTRQYWEGVDTYFYELLKNFNDEILACDPSEFFG